MARSAVRDFGSLPPPQPNGTSSVKVISEEDWGGEICSARRRP